MFVPYISSSSYSSLATEVSSSTKSSPIYYTLQTVNRSTYNIIYSCLLITCMTVTLISLIIFFKKLYSFERNCTKWLPEQKWVIVYCISLLIYMNAIGVAIIFGLCTRDPSLPYANIIITFIGEWCIATVWLFFSAPLLCRQQSVWVFYTPRVVFILIVFIIGALVVTYKFTDIINDSDASLYADVRTWSTVNTKTYMILATTYHSLVWFYYFIWIVQMFYTRYQLSKISYMKNRYIHLSFRYFTLQGSLVILYYIITFFVVDSNCFKNGLRSWYEAFYSLSLGYYAIEIDFAFETVYCVILAFIYWPIQNVSKYELELNMLTSYVIAEDEYIEKVKLRKVLLGHLNEFQNYYNIKFIYIVLIELLNYVKHRMKCISISLVNLQPVDQDMMLMI